MLDRCTLSYDLLHVQICRISEISFYGLEGWVGGRDKLRSYYGIILTFDNYGHPLSDMSYGLCKYLSLSNMHTARPQFWIEGRILASTIRA